LAVADEVGQLKTTVKDVTAGLKTIAETTAKIQKFMEEDPESDGEGHDDEESAGDQEDKDSKPDPRAAARALAQQQTALETAMQSALAAAGGGGGGGGGPTGSATLPGVAPSGTLPATTYHASPYHYHAPQPVPFTTITKPTMGPFGPQIPSSAYTVNPTIPAGMPQGSTGQSAGPMYHAQAGPSVRQIALDPTQWIGYVGSAASGGTQRLDLLIHELQNKYHVDKLEGAGKAAAETCLESVRTYLQITSTAPDPSIFNHDALVVAARGLWYGSLTHTHGQKTADAWLQRACDAPVTFAHFAQAFDGLKSPKDQQKDPKGSGAAGGGGGNRVRRFRTGRKWRGGFNRYGGGRQGQGQGGGRGAGDQSGKGDKQGGGKNG
jgi:hypothetical protein